MKSSFEFERKHIALAAAIVSLAPALGGCAVESAKSPQDRPDLVSCEVLANAIATNNAGVVEAVDPGGNGSCRNDDGSVSENGGGRS